MLPRLRELRQTVLNLHRALLHSERIIYEQFHGRIQTNNEFFQLVISHDWFQWLRPISQFIVQMDDVLGSKEPVTEADVSRLFDDARSLLNPAQEGTSLETRYFRAIQRDPDIALMHAQVSRILSIAD